MMFRAALGRWPIVNLANKPRFLSSLSTVRSIYTAISLIMECDEVRDAKREGRGIVALESTLITHGLPYPHNLSVAKRLEAIIREEGATPATIALMNGRIRVGLNDDELAAIADTHKNRAVKASLRDICNGGFGGTTVAATMWIADRAGIRIFATGGIGGVHRGVEKTFDISADLTELGRVSVAVVCAGAKSILDVAKTLEVLETNSVNVIVYGEDNRFPGFFTPKTEHRVTFNTSSLEKIADILVYGERLNMPGGTLIACPLPAEFAKDGDFIESCVEKAVKESAVVSNKEVTPFILQRVNELSGSASMQINIALLENNARIAAKLANMYAAKSAANENDFENNFQVDSRNVIRSTNNDDENNSDKDTVNKIKPWPKVICVGASIFDIEVRINETNVENNGGYYPAETYMRAGGVARNHADALSQLGCNVYLVSAFAYDLRGYELDRLMDHMDLNNIVHFRGARTASSVGVSVNGQIINGFIDVDNIMEYFTPNHIVERAYLFSKADAVILDANLTVPTMRAVLELAGEYNILTWFEPTNYLKASKIFADMGMWSKVNAISPNAMEFRVLCECLGIPIQDSHLADLFALHRFFDESSAAHRFFQHSLQYMLITLDAQGSLLVHANGHIIEVPPPQLSAEIVSVSGAGDCFNSGFLTGRLKGLSVEESVELARRCALKSLLSMDAVPNSLYDLADELPD